MNHEIKPQLDDGQYGDGCDRLKGRYGMSLDAGHAVKETGQQVIQGDGKPEFKIVVQGDRQGDHDADVSHTCVGRRILFFGTQRFPSHVTCVPCAQVDQGDHDREDHQDHPEHGGVRELRQVNPETDHDGDQADKDRKENSVPVARCPLQRLEILQRVDDHPLKRIRYVPDCC